MGTLLALVMSIAVKPKDSAMMANFSKAVGKFTREDPTLRVTVDDKSKQTIMSGMGELHLDIYVERLKREYNVECITGNPSVSYKETVTMKSNFNYLHKKQSGGSGQYAKVIGFIEPLEEEIKEKGIDFEFENRGAYVRRYIIEIYVCEGVHCRNRRELTNWLSKLLLWKY